MNPYIYPTSIARSSTAPIPVPKTPLQGPQISRSNLMITSYSEVTSCFALTVSHDHDFLISYEIQGVGPKPPTPIVCFLAEPREPSAFRKRFPVSARTPEEKQGNRSEQFMKIMNGFSIFEYVHSPGMSLQKFPHYIREREKEKHNQTLPPTKQTPVPANHSDI